jgi:hypothetical protein
MLNYSQIISLNCSQIIHKFQKKYKLCGLQLREGAAPAPVPRGRSGRGSSGRCWGTRRRASLGTAAYGQPGRRQRREAGAGVRRRTTGLGCGSGWMPVPRGGVGVRASRGETSWTRSDAKQPASLSRYSSWPHIRLIKGGKTTNSCLANLIFKRTRHSTPA